MQKETDSSSMAPFKEEPWYVLGAGAIGSLFAWHLAEAGSEPVLIYRSAPSHPVTIDFHPLAAQNPDPKIRPFRVDDGISPILRLLVAVKAHQTEPALLSIRNRITPATLIVLLQNGMGSWEIVQHLFPNNPCLLATTTEGAHRSSENKIIHAGKGVTWIGALKQNEREIAFSLAQEWQTLKLELEYDPNIMRRLWQKLAINCAINPLTVVHNCSNGKLLDNQDALLTMEGVCLEVESVMAKALGQSLLPSEVGHLFDLVREVATKTSNNISSMLQDVRAGRDTEIEFITGYLVREAERFSISVPLNRSLLTQLRSARNHSD